MVLNAKIRTFISSHKCIGKKNLKLRNVAWVLLFLHINGNTFCGYIATLLIRYAIINLLFLHYFSFLLLNSHQLKKYFVTLHREIYGRT